MLAKLYDSSNDGLGLKNWLDLGTSDTDYDKVLTGLIKALSDRFSGDCNRVLERAVGRTEIHSGGENTISLAAYPIETITSVKEAYSEDFAGVEAMVEKSDFYILNSGRSGLIARSGDMRWLSGDNTVQVIYTGGYLDPATTPVPSGATVVPVEIQYAVIEQARFCWNRRKEIGLENIGMGGGNWTISTAEPWLASVRSVINRYRRYSL